MQTSLPPRPDDLESMAPIPKRERRWPLVAFGVVGTFVALVIIGTFIVPQDDTDTPVRGSDTIVVDEPAAPEVDVNLEAARIAFDVQSASDQAALCDYYNTPPVGVDSEMAKIFADAAGLSQAEGERVLTIVLSEEC
jgi:hypothetical protein